MRPLLIKQFYFRFTAQIGAAQQTTSANRYAFILFDIDINVSHVQQ